MKDELEIKLRIKELQKMQVKARREKWYLDVQKHTGAIQALEWVLRLKSSNK